MNKLTKLLSIFLVAGAFGAGVAGVTACGDGGDDNNNQEDTHVHTYDTTKWQSDGNGKHYHPATCDHKNEKGGLEDCVDSDENGKCDKCAADMPGYVKLTALNVNVANNATRGYVGGTLACSVATTPADATNKQVTWSVSDQNVAAVDAEGNVLFKDVGTVKVIATSKLDASIKAESAEITVYASFTLGKTKTLTVASSTSLSPVWTPASGAKTITWSSSDESIVTVNDDGLINAVKVGKATITATVAESGFSATVDVLVGDAEPEKEYIYDVGAGATTISAAGTYVLNLTESSLGGGHFESVYLLGSTTEGEARKYKITLLDDGAEFNDEHGDLITAASPAKEILVDYAEYVNFIFAHSDDEVSKYLVKVELITDGLPARGSQELPIRVGTPTDYWNPEVTVEGMTAGQKVHCRIELSLASYSPYSIKFAYDNSKIKINFPKESYNTNTWSYSYTDFEPVNGEGFFYTDTHSDAKRWYYFTVEAKEAGNQTFTVSGVKLKGQTQEDAIVITDKNTYTQERLRHAYYTYTATANGKLALVPGEGCQVTVNDDDYIVETSSYGCAVFEAVAGTTYHIGVHNSFGPASFTLRDFNAATDTGYSEDLPPREVTAAFAPDASGVNLSSVTVDCLGAYSYYEITAPSNGLISDVILNVDNADANFTAYLRVDDEYHQPIEFDGCVMKDAKIKIRISVMQNSAQPVDFSEVQMTIIWEEIKGEYKQVDKNSEDKWVILSADKLTINTDGTWTVSYLGDNNVVETQSGTWGLKSKSVTSYGDTTDYSIVELKVDTNVMGYARVAEGIVVLFETEDDAINIVNPLIVYYNGATIDDDTAEMLDDLLGGGASVDPDPDPDPNEPALANWYGEVEYSDYDSTWIVNGDSAVTVTEDNGTYTFSYSGYEGTINASYGYYILYIDSEAKFIAVVDGNLLIVYENMAALNMRNAMAVFCKNTTLTSLEIQAAEMVLGGSQGGSVQDEVDTAPQSGTALTIDDGLTQTFSADGYTLLYFYSETGGDYTISWTGDSKLAVQNSDDDDTAMGYYSGATFSVSPGMYKLFYVKSSNWNDATQEYVAVEDTITIAEDSGSGGGDAVLEWLNEGDNEVSGDNTNGTKYCFMPWSGDETYVITFSGVEVYDESFNTITSGAEYKLNANNADNVKFMVYGEGTVTVTKKAAEGGSSGEGNE